MNYQNRGLKLSRSFGFADIVVLLGMLLISVSLPIATRLVQQNQENRSNAASTNDASYAVCGSGINCVNCSQDKCGKEGGNTCHWGYNGSTSMRCYSDAEKPPTPTPIKTLDCTVDGKKWPNGAAICSNNVAYVCKSGTPNKVEDCGSRGCDTDGTCKDKKDNWQNCDKSDECLSGFCQPTLKVCAPDGCSALACGKCDADGCKRLEKDCSWGYNGSSTMYCYSKSSAMPTPDFSCTVNGKKWPDGAAICSNNLAYVCKSGHLSDPPEECEAGCDTNGKCKEVKKPVCLSSNCSSCTEDECSKLIGSCIWNNGSCKKLEIGSCSGVNGVCKASCGEGEELLLGNGITPDCKGSLCCVKKKEDDTVIVPETRCTWNGVLHNDTYTFCSSKNESKTCNQGKWETNPCPNGCDSSTGKCNAKKANWQNCDKSDECLSGYCQPILKVCAPDGCSALACNKCDAEGCRRFTKDCSWGYNGGSTMYCYSKYSAVPIPDFSCTVDGKKWPNGAAICSNNVAYVCKSGTPNKVEDCGSRGCDTDGTCKDKIDGACSATVVNKCDKGDSVDVDDISKYYVWTCKGINGGLTKTCMLAKPAELTTECEYLGGYCDIESCAPDGDVLYPSNTGIGCPEGYMCCKKKTVAAPGVCGGAHRTVTTTKPTSGLCKTTYGNSVVTASVNDLTKTWIWSCWGISEGSPVTCYTLRPEIVSSPGVCGDAHRTVTTTKPTSGLCKTNYGGSAVTASVSDLSKTWIWSCYGSDKKAESAVSCFTLRPVVKPVNGVCGGANRRVFDHAPSVDLCLYGKLVYDDMEAADGDYNWRCLGYDGGSDVRCQAGKKTVTPIITGSIDHPSPTTADKKSVLKFKVAFLGLKPSYKDNGGDYSCIANFKSSKVEIINVTTGSTQKFSNVQPMVLKGEVDSKGNQIFLISLEVSPSFASLDNNNVIKIKGPVHLKQRMCLDKQSESLSTTVKCNIDLFRDDNYIYDFSGYTLLAGDVNQDGVVNGVDFSLVKNSMSLSDGARCGVENDLNMDGVVNSLDLSLITNFSLSKQDE